MIKPRIQSLNKDSLLNILKEEKPFLKRTFGVKKIAVFGSFVKGTAIQKSDVDLYVHFTKPTFDNFLGLIDYLEKRLKREVDVLTPGGIKSMKGRQVAKDIKRSLVNV